MAETSTTPKKHAGGRPADTFVTALAGRLGVSRSAACQYNLVATYFTPELAVRVIAIGLTHAQQVALARLRNPERIDEYVTAVECGELTCAEAVRRAKLERSYFRKFERGLLTEEEAVKQLNQDALTEPESDEAWLETKFGYTIQRLADPEPFKQDAILWRRLEKEIAQFQKESLPYLESGSRPKRNGHLHAMLERLSIVGHPGTWTLCETCRGLLVGPNGECGDCDGRGYTVAPKSFFEFVATRGSRLCR